MTIEKVEVISNETIGEGIFLMKVFAPAIADSAKPGQFCNIKVSESDFPLLRRPFSICDVENGNVFFMFDIHGEGTKILSQKKSGDELDILGPLGNGFDFNGEFDSAIIIAGGLGSAPFPFLIKNIPGNISVTCFVGGRSKKNIITYGMKNIFVSTDDGTDGFKGTVLDLFKKHENEIENKNIRIFSCGPNPMLNALREYSIQKKYRCQISVESAMACGFGICQGCPIEKSNGDGYYLICKDGPVFEAETVIL